MVSLVKARKKAKERKEGMDAATAAIADTSAATADAAVAAPSPSEPPAQGVVDAQPVVAPAADPAPESLSKLEAFKQSANRLHRTQGVLTASEARTTEQLELLLFLIDGEQYALPIEKIFEIISPREATRVPNADESVVGIISLRGTIVSILDIRRKLGHPSNQQAGAESRIIVVENDGETAGFLVDRVLRVVRIEPALLESHPVVAAAEQSEFIRGVFQHGQKLSILLDLERLLRF